MAPDIYLLGKALGGGIVPLSAVVADRDVLRVLHPGEHESTFGCNPLAAAIGTTVVGILRSGEFQARSTELGQHLHQRLHDLIGGGLLAVRGLGVWAGVDIDPSIGTGKQVSVRLAERGVLVKDTHGSTSRFAWPLRIGPSATATNAGTPTADTSARPTMKGPHTRYAAPSRVSTNPVSTTRGQGP